VKAGELGERFDVLIIPSMSTEAIVHGHEPGAMPPQYVGGITRGGVLNIKSFVEGGGTLVTLNTGCFFAISELGLPLRDALQHVRPSWDDEDSEATEPPKFTCPNSLVRMEFDATHPISYGMPEEAAAVFTESLAFGTIASFDSERKPKVAAKYSDEELLMSGFLEGEKYLQGEGAVVEVPLGRGKVVLLGFGVQHRGQPHGTFKLLFNSLYYGASR
jgi:hypothetical protein